VKHRDRFDVLRKFKCCATLHTDEWKKLLDISNDRAAAFFIWVKWSKKNEWFKDCKLLALKGGVCSSYSGAMKILFFSHKTLSWYFLSDRLLGDLASKVLNIHIFNYKHVLACPSISDRFEIQQSYFKRRKKWNPYRNIRSSLYCTFEFVELYFINLSILSLF